MRFQIVGDYCSTSGVGKTLSTISDAGYFQFFKTREYGKGLDGIGIVLMCQPSDLKLKPRIRYSKKEKQIFMDIMLELEVFKNASEEWRLDHVYDRILKEMQTVVRNYKIADFDLDSFILDVKYIFSRLQ